MYIVSKQEAMLTSELPKVELCTLKLYSLFQESPMD